MTPPIAQSVRVTQRAEVDDTAWLRAQVNAMEAEARLGTWRWTRGESAVELSAGLMKVVGLEASVGALPARTLLRLFSAPHRRILLDAVRGQAPVFTELIFTPSGASRQTIIALSVRSEFGVLWGVGRDITEWRTATAALERNRLHWQTLIQSAGYATWEFDWSTGLARHSPAWRTMRGLLAEGDPSDTHSNWLARVHPDDRSRLTEIFAKQAAGDLIRTEIEYRERRADTGEYLSILSLSAPVEWDHEGRPLRIVGVDNDITAKKTADAQMAQLSRRLELALEVSGLGIFEANLETGEVFWDHGVRRIYGMSETSPVQPDTWESCLHPEDRAEAVRRVDECVASKGPFVSDFRIIRPDGQVRNIHTVGAWYRDSEGVAKVLGMNWDVTGEVAIRADLERARELAEARSAELEAAKARIEHDAMHDALTGLPNRRFLDAHIAGLFSGAADSGLISALHLDLDLFKQINDTFGHAAGDAILVHVAKLLRAAAGSQSFVARVGGDEFCVVSGSLTGKRELVALAEDILGRIRQPVSYEGQDCRFGGSIGIAVLDRTADQRRLLVNADIALYRAKRSGKNRYVFLTAELEVEAVNVKRLADDLTRGIEQDEFAPFFQPLFDAGTFKLVGAEALARWHHPTRGVLSPDAFLKTAEDLNVVAALDGAILRKAVGEFRRWEQRGLRPPPLSVNVSFRRLNDPHLLDSLRRLNPPAGTLSFELLESVFLDELDDVARWNLDQIREMGIDISIDDFGTGHASIVSLQKIRPRRLKLDRSFLQDLTGSPSQQAVVRSIIHIGKSLDIQVVAEGVETPYQIDVLRALGCDILQGFVFARPMSTTEFEVYLEFDQKDERRAAL